MRDTGDSAFYTIAGSVLTNNITMTTNTIRRYNPASNVTWNKLNVNSGCRLTIIGGNLSVVNV